jgi:hypothetical protein
MMLDISAEYVKVTSKEGQAFQQFHQRRHCPSPTLQLLRRRMAKW